MREYLTSLVRIRGAVISAGRQLMGFQRTVPVVFPSVIDRERDLWYDPAPLAKSVCVCECRASNPGEIREGVLCPPGVLCPARSNCNTVAAESSMSKLLERAEREGEYLSYTMVHLNNVEMHHMMTLRLYWKVVCVQNYTMDTSN